MRIAIAGAGAVGRAVALELLGNGHKVLLIERNPDRYRPDIVPDADWLLADACELSTLQEAEVQNCDAVIAASGDDKANVAVSMLAKSEFGVPRVVARVNNAGNEWLFTEAWGVDQAVSTPRAMVAAVEGAIDVGHLIRMLALRQGQSEVAKLTLDPANSLVGQRICDITLPKDTLLAAVLRDGRVIVPPSEEPLEPSDEMVFIAPREQWS
ncbi:MAG: TrkA family potassium uptake protein [Mycobacterium sp.]|nr:TrkA family potassium uptake protein [Mycobacterium sp.]